MEKKKQNNIHITEIPKGKKKGTDSIFKAILAKNFLNLVRERHPDPWGPKDPKEVEPRKGYRDT